jgi:plasmid stability protein
MTMLTLAGNVRQGLQRWVIIGLAALSLGLSGCAMVRIGYGSADELAYRWLDSWFDFNDTQAAKAREGLESLHAWHRKTQLPDYAQFLAKTGQDMLRDTTPQAVCKLTADVFERVTRAGDFGMPQVVEIAVTLSDAQLANMQKRFEKGQAKFRDDYVKSDAKDREAAQLERSISRAESIYGSIDANQRDVLTQAVSTNPFDAQAALAERAVRHTELMQMLRAARSVASEGKPEAAHAQLRSGLKKWFDESRASPRPAYRAYQQKVSEYTCALSAKVHNAAGPATRQAARDKLKGWEGDARYLAGVAAAQ